MNDNCPQTFPTVSDKETIAKPPVTVVPFAFRQDKRLYGNPHDDGLCVLRSLEDGAARRSNADRGLWPFLGRIRVYQLLHEDRPGQISDLLIRGQLQTRNPAFGLDGCPDDVPG